jgi:hypothetical protein
MMIASSVGIAVNSRCAIILPILRLLRAWAYCVFYHR